MELRFYFDGRRDVDRPFLLLLHGFMGSAKDWNWAVKTFEADFRCVLADLPGHSSGEFELPAGWNTATIPLSSGTMEDLSEAMEVFRTLVLKTHWSVAGYSMGGRVALYLACKKTHTVQKLALISASPGLRTPEERNQRIKNDTALSVILAEMAILPQNVQHHMRRSFFEDWYANPIWSPIQMHTSVLEAMIHTKMNGDLKGWAASLQTIGTGTQPSLWPELPNLSLPVCLITGSEDHKFTKINQEMAWVLPQAQHRVISGVGHALPFESPDQLTEELRHFLI
ncbi:MAG: alpha/beta fold hydrolase [Rhodothermia bacterium]|nr:alpha/beta fold hydrolase [Rhodothermia bacterium]